MPPRKDPLHPVEKMTLQEGKLRLEKVIFRGEQLLTSPSLTEEQFKTWHTNAGKTIEQIYPNTGHIYTFIGTPRYSANLPFGVVPLMEHQKELRREIDVLKGLLQQVEDDLAIETTPPQTSVASDFWSDLHPEIIRVSQELFKGGHYAKSVLAALLEINDQVKRVYKQRVGQEKDGSDLMKQVFSPNNRVIVLGDLSTKSGQDTQLGFMEIFSGAMTGIRNPNAHENLTLTENEAKHYLYLASLLIKIFKDGVSGKLHHIPSTP